MSVVSTIDGADCPRRSPVSDRLVARALLHALDADSAPQVSAAPLARLASGHPESLDRAIAQILRRENGRPTAVTRRAAASLRLARSLLPPPEPADGLARLADEEQPLAVVRDDPDRAGVRDPLACDVLAVLVAERALADVNDGALEDRAGVQALEA